MTIHSESKGMAISTTKLRWGQTFHETGKLAVCFFKLLG